MPRTAGLSCNSVTRPILLSFRPISVARCEWWRRIALPVCSTLMMFAALAIVVNSETSLVGHDLFGKRYPLFRIKPVLFSNHFGVAADPARLQCRHIDVAARRNRARRILVLQRIDCLSMHVVVVRYADRL